MDHHILPRMYLKGFTDPDIPDTGRPFSPFVWLYSTEKKAWRRRAPENVANPGGFYDYTDRAGERVTGLETILSQYESRAATVLRAKIETCRPLSQDERVDLAVFAVTLMMRVPNHIDMVNEMLTDDVRAKLLSDRREFENPEKLAEFKAAYRRDTGRNDLDDLSLETFDPEVIEGITVERNPAVLFTFAGLGQCASLLYDMSWIFLRSVPPHYFITSDSPFALFDPTGRCPHAIPGFALKPVQVSLPLTRQTALLARWGGPPVSWQLASSGIVRMVNFRTVRTASHFIVAPKREFPGAGKMLAEHPAFRQGPISEECPP